MLSKGILNQRSNRKTGYNKNFKIKGQNSLLTEEEKTKLLFEVFDILFAIKKEKSFQSEEKKATQ